LGRSWEAAGVFQLTRDLLTTNAPAVAALLTIRSAYERLQLAKALDGVRQETFSLAPMPKGAYAEVIKAPAQRLDGTPRALRIEDDLVDALLTDVETGVGKDALPLLAFTLERLYLEHGGDRDLRLTEYEQLGRVKGSIEAAARATFGPDSSLSKMQPEWLDSECVATMRRVHFLQLLSNQRTAANDALGQGTIPVVA
jgi:hypothetical protein